MQPLSEAVQEVINKGSPELGAYFVGSRAAEEGNYKNQTRVVCEFAKEEAQLRATIDRFFGTTNGFIIEETTVVNLDNSTTTSKKPIGSDIFKEMESLELLLCGGAINSIFSGKEINDLDFYMQNPHKKEECVAFLQKHFPIVAGNSINAITFKRKNGRRVYTAQLITRFAGSPKEIFDWFDFTITHAAYNFADQQFHFGDRFFQDLAKRVLVYSGHSRYPICAMYRTKKYMDRGYNLPGSTIMHIALAIVQLEIKNYKELKEQLMGIDTSYLEKFLSTVDPQNPVDYGVFIHEAFKSLDRTTGNTPAEQEDRVDGSWGE